MCRSVTNLATIRSDTVKEEPFLGTIEIISRHSKDYGVPFVSKLCILLIGRFSTKNQLNIFSNKILHQFCTSSKISGRFFDNKILSWFFVQVVAKYRVDFLAKKYSVKLLCKLQNIQFSVILNNTQLALFGNSIGGRKGNATDL